MTDTESGNEEGDTARKWQNMHKGESTAAVCVAGESMAFYRMTREKQRKMHAIFRMYIPAIGEKSKPNLRTLQDWRSAQECGESC